MPVAELESLRDPGQQWKELDLEPGANPFSKFSGELFDIEAEIELGESSTLTLDIRGTPLVYDTTMQTLSCLGKSVEVSPIGGRIRLRVLVDRTSIEVFANGGRYVMSFCFRPDAANQNLSLAVSGGAATARSLNVWPLKSIWPVVTDPEK
jgi:sucrose-6-phosphate hydrolase SacC (GH32 family)